MAERLIDLVLMAPFFIFGIVLHEYAHGWVAWKLGDPTAKYSGRLTLDPMAHFDPFGALMFLFSSLVGVGFGWAKPVPVNFYNLRNPRRDTILVSLAGPGANILLAIACLLCHHLFRSFSPPLSSWFALGFLLNLVLAIFNLLPIPPLDGSKVLMVLLPPRYAYTYARMEPFGFIILLAFLATGLFSLIVNAVINLLRFLL
ncbi:site-2 protease family protein [bacterium]|nr:site-2 protease family protein [bacterium]